MEKILVPIEKPNIHFIGENKDGVILTYNDYTGKPIPGGGEITTGTSYSVKVIGNDFYARDLSFQNSAGDIAQAVALMVVGDRAGFSNVNILGNQVSTIQHCNEHFNPENSVCRTLYTPTQKEIVTLDNTTETVTLKEQQISYLVLPQPCLKIVI